MKIYMTNQKEVITVDKSISGELYYFLRDNSLDDNSSCFISTSRSAI